MGGYHYYELSDTFEILTLCYIVEIFSCDLLVIRLKYRCALLEDLLHVDYLDYTEIALPFGMADSSAKLYRACLIDGEFLLTATQSLERLKTR